MTDAALGAIQIAASDELESPARRALRRLFKRKGAVVGLAVIAAFIVLAMFAPLVVPFVDDCRTMTYDCCCCRLCRCSS